MYAVVYALGQVSDSRKTLSTPRPYICIYLHCCLYIIYIYILCTVCGGEGIQQFPQLILELSCRDAYYTSRVLYMGTYGTQCQSVDGWRVKRAQGYYILVRFPPPLTCCYAKPPETAVGGILSYLLSLFLYIFLFFNSVR